MNNIVTKTTEKKSAVKVAVKEESISPELIKDIADKVGHLWQIMNEHTVVLNEMRKQIDQVRKRMGL
jgi:phosphoribosyl-ATP pyrophosphohydrolase